MATSLLKFCLSGEILQNLVTLMTQLFYQSRDNKKPDRIYAIIRRRMTKQFFAFILLSEKSTNQGR